MGCDVPHRCQALSQDRAEPVPPGHADSASRLRLLWGGLRPMPQNEQTRTPRMACGLSGELLRLTVLKSMGNHLEPLRYVKPLARVPAEDSC